MLHGVCLARLGHFLKTEEQPPLTMDRGLSFIVGVPAYLLMSLTMTIYIQQGLADVRCRSAPNCTACIAMAPACVWCYQVDIRLTSRCDTADNLKASGCSKHMFLPHSTIAVVKDEPLRRTVYEAGIDSILLRPQHLNLHLTPGRPVNFSVDFLIDRDHPLDLYYLMDLSYSMLDDKQSLTTLGSQLERALTEITRNVRLGFGGFVDKPILPYTRVSPEARNNPCYPSTLCAPIYGFVNHLPLTNITEGFSTGVTSAKISGNLDYPEGIFDALVQVLACQNEIGWRHDSRKIIVVATDAPGKNAGDGKIAGITEPNDGLCHLHNGSYTHSALQDYPSLGQIAALIKEKSINVIFAVTTGYLQYYMAIAKLLPGSVVAVLHSNSSNIVGLVTSNYEAILAKIQTEIRGLDKNDGIDVRIATSCQGSQLTETTTCEGLRAGSTVSFNVQLTLSECNVGRRSPGSRSSTFQFGAVGIEERLTIQLTRGCSCNCSDEEEKSYKCSGAGYYSCGSCLCEPGFSGKRCECMEKLQLIDDRMALTLCKRNGSDMDCSGRGVCTSCGKCDCTAICSLSDEYCSSEHRFSGDFCECDAYGCNRYNNRICGGKGTCLCDSQGHNYCQCDEEHANGLYDACDCDLRTDSCRSQENSTTRELCSGHGICTCGVCNCTDKCYRGPLCEIVMPECEDHCLRLESCVQCTKAGRDVCSELCSNMDVTIDSDIAEEGNARKCYYIDSEACISTYFYHHDSALDHYVVTVHTKKSCPSDVYIAIAIGGSAAIVAIILLALFIWKALVTYYDRREYEAFLRDADQATWSKSGNPLYQQATHKYQNPTYNGEN